MLFNSITFAIFLPVVFILYYLVPHKFRWAFLLCASYVFYMNLHIGYGLLLLFTTILTYILARLLEASPTGSRKKLCLWGGVLPLVLILLLYKTANPLIAQLNERIEAGSLSLQPITLTVLLPAGVSFYFFQSMGYLIGCLPWKNKSRTAFRLLRPVRFFLSAASGRTDRQGRQSSASIQEGTSFRLRKCHLWPEINGLGLFQEAGNR